MDLGQQQFACRIELSKSGGITILIKDLQKQELFSRKIVLDATSITLTCKDGVKTSTITQKDDSVKTEVKTASGSTSVEQDGETITVKCKTFKVEADTFTLKSTQDGTVETGGNCTIKSTKDTTVSATGALSLASVQATSVDAKQGASIKAATNLSLEGMQTTVKGTSQVSVDTSGTASFGGMTVAVKGQTQASLEAPVTSIGQNMTTVKGQMVEVSGALIKLG